jgi:hypothetical protein
LRRRNSPTQRKRSAACSRVIGQSIIGVSEGAMPGYLPWILDRLEPPIIDATALLTFVLVGVKIWESTTVQNLLRRWRRRR